MLIIRPRLLPILLAALLQLTLGAPAAAQDGDADGIIDEQDNCLVVGNPTQLDTNLDGYGNRCDTDYNNDGLCAAADFSAFKQAYFSQVGDPNYDPDIDVEGNGVIAGSDFSVFKQNYMLPVAPSGLGCAGAIPCTCAAPVLDSVEEVLPWDVELSWTAAAGSRFEIERRAAGGTWTTVASPSASELSRDGLVIG